MRPKTLIPLYNKSAYILEGHTTKIRNVTQTCLWTY